MGLPMRKRKVRNSERGIALLVVLLALFLISAIGMGMMYMSTTETAVNANYRDTQRAFFSMRAGLEEMRDRMRLDAPIPITLPTLIGSNANMPSASNPGSIVYILNPSSATDTVAPTVSTNAYFDDEFCHEVFSGVSYTGVVTGVPCNSTQAVPSGAWTTYNSVMAYNTTSSALYYKWVRITLKQNGTFGTNGLVDSTQGTSSQVCWNTNTNNEVAVTALGYSTCTAAQAHGALVEPVYIVTALAITPSGSRRMGQYEVAALDVLPPPAALSLAGAGTNFNPPNSSNTLMDGIDGQGSPPSLPASCTPTGGSVPGIGTSDIADQTSYAAQIPGGRTGNYTGTAPTFPAGVTATPSVVDMGTDASGTQALLNYSNPVQLNSLVSQIANGADQTLTCNTVNSLANPAGGTSAGCSGTAGTAATPQVTYVNGDFTLNGGAGVLVVTGNLTISGGMTFDGLILVVGQGTVRINGGGGGGSSIYGSVFVANTNSRSSPFAQNSVATGLGTPEFTWHGGGDASIYYNSCWAGYGDKLHYFVISSREEMY
jgi:Tfp pilus assembly protein PilX